MKRLVFILLSFFLFVSVSGQIIQNIGPVYRTTKTSSGSPSALMNNIISYWKLDETSGSVIDSVGNNSGTASGVTTNQTTAKAGTSYLFNGDENTSYVNCGTNSSLQITSGTVSVWVYRTFTDANYHIIVGKYDITNDINGYGLATDGNNIYWEIDDASTYKIGTWTTALASNAWTHIALTFTGGSSATIYVNGASQTESIEITPTFSASIPFLIGCNPDFSAYPFGGYIDQVRVWGRVLSSSEILSLYHNGL